MANTFSYDDLPPVANQSVANSNPNGQFSYDDLPPVNQSGAPIANQPAQIAPTNPNVIRAAQIAGGITGMPPGLGLGVANSLANFGKDVANIPHTVGTLTGNPNLAPQYQFPAQVNTMLNSGQGLPGYGTGKFVGNVIPFATGAEALEAPRALAAASDIPGVSQAAQWLGGEIPGIRAAFGGSQVLPALARQTSGAALYGAITDPNNPTGNAKMGAAIAAPLSLVPFGAIAIGQGLSKVNPGPVFKTILDKINSYRAAVRNNAATLDQQSSDLSNGILSKIQNDQALHQSNAQDAQQQIEALHNDILNTLSGGNATLEGSAQAGASAIKQAGDQRAAANKLRYQPVFDQLGDKPVYSQNNVYTTGNKNVSINDLGSSGSVLNSGRPNQLEASYPSVAKNAAGQFDSDTAALHSKFVNNPTFQNAHNLQSQLGTSLAQLRRNPFPDLSTQGAISSLQNAKNAIDSDISSFLGNASPDLQAQYAAATQDFRQNVAPYRNNPDIAAIVKGQVTNPDNLASIFKNPEPATQKVLSDLPDNTKNQILQSNLGTLSKTSTPEKTVQNFNSAVHDKGLQGVVTPQLQNKVDQLTQLLSDRDKSSEMADALSKFNNIDSPEKLNDTFEKINSNPSIQKYVTPDLKNQFDNLATSLAARDKNQDMFKSLSKINQISSPEKLQQKLSTNNVTDDENLKTYLPTLQQQLDSLSKKIKYRSNLYHGLGLAGGLAGGHALGMDSAAADLIGGAIGTKIAPALIGGMAKIPGIKPTYGAISNGISATYPWLQRGVIANSLARGGQ